MLTPVRRFGKNAVHAGTIALPRAIAMLPAPGWQF
jgi:hypothetical protein